MIHVYRISNGLDVGDTLDSIKAVEAVARDNGPGRFHVDEIGRDPLPSGHTSRRWGVVIKRDNGTVGVELDPWPDR